jgi:hypothetical protein
MRDTRAVRRPGAAGRATRTGLCGRNVARSVSGAGPATNDGRRSLRPARDRRREPVRRPRRAALATRVAPPAETPRRRLLRGQRWLSTNVARCRRCSSAGSRGRTGRSTREMDAMRPQLAPGTFVRRSAESWQLRKPATTQKMRRMRSRIVHASGALSGAALFLASAFADALFRTTPGIGRAQWLGMAAGGAILAVSCYLLLRPPVSQRQPGPASGRRDNTRAGAAHPPRLHLRLGRRRGSGAREGRGLRVRPDDRTRAGPAPRARCRA